MPFSDDDLKRLKEQYSMAGIEAIGNKLSALLARLEAAEAVVSLATQYTLIADEVVPIGEAVEAWRKAKGEDEK